VKANHIAPQDISLKVSIPIRYLYRKYINLYDFCCFSQNDNDMLLIKIIPIGSQLVGQTMEKILECSEFIKSSDTPDVE
jgi:hypothetical protein